MSKASLELGHNIKKATNDDFLAISKLDREAWGTKQINKYIPDGEHAWRLWIDNALVYCSFDDDKLVGVALAFPTTNDSYVVHKIFVDENYRNQKHGALLFEKLIQTMDLLQKNSFLTVSPENKNAIKLYEKMGYKFDKLVKGYYRKQEDRVILVRRFIC